jgi:hypothetical protein
MRFRNRTLVCRLAAAATLAGLVGLELPAQAAPEIDQQSPPKKRTDLKDIRVPIPSWSRDVVDNGCRMHEAPAQNSSDTNASSTEIPFWALVSHAAGRHTVQLTVGGPEKFFNDIAPLDEEMRRLVLLYALWDNWGRDGLHTFFYLRGGALAPAIRDTLRDTGLAREHDLFARAMTLFGATYPVADAVREKAFGYTAAGQELNEFDHKLLALGSEFGTKESYAAAVIAYVNRTPALWQRIEGLREQLGDMERLELLTGALMTKVDLSQPPGEIDRQLSTLTKELRAMFAVATFNREFENGGVHQFFYNSEGAIAPEVHDALIELGLERQAGLLKKAVAMFGAAYLRDTQQRRDVHFHNHDGWNGWDEQLSALTDDFYALDGGPVAVRVGGDMTIDGGPGIRHAMLSYARRHNLLPC